MSEHWIILALIGAATFAMRWAFIGWWAHHDIAPRVRRWLEFVPPAAFAALTASAILVRDGALVGTLADARLLAGALAAGVALATRKVLLTIAVGLIALQALQRGFGL